MTQAKVDPETEVHVCSICGVDYIGWGHNAEPINEGRCCDSCNDLVIMRRINDLSRSRANKK